MGSANIQAKIKKGLAKAVNKTGSSNSELVYLVSKTTTAGNPINPGTTTETDILLVDAIFQTYDQRLVTANIKAGDRRLVSNNDVAISVGNIIKQGSTKYIVIDVDQVSPTSDTLVYKSQVRVQ